MQKGVFYNAKEHLLKTLLPILFTFTVLLRLADGGQCWFHDRQRAASKSSERNGKRNRLFSRAAAAKDSKILFIPNIFLSLHLDYRTH